MFPFEPQNKITRKTMKQSSLPISVLIGHLARVKLWSPVLEKRKRQKKKEKKLNPGRGEQKVKIQLQMGKKMGLIGTKITHLRVKNINIKGIQVNPQTRKHIFLTILEKKKFFPS